MNPRPGIASGYRFSVIRITCGVLISYPALYSVVYHNILHNMRSERMEKARCARYLPFGALQPHCAVHGMGDTPNGTAQSGGESDEGRAYRGRMADWEKAEDRREGRMRYWVCRAAGEG